MNQEYRLFQLISPSLPVGAFSYSQGLEWAVESGWVDSESALVDWLNCLGVETLQYLELPILRRLYQAARDEDVEALEHWVTQLYVTRETSELRLEEVQRGRTMRKLLEQLGLTEPDSPHNEAIGKSALAGFACAGVKWNIEPDALCRGYAWSWLENSVMAGVKLIPLGQTAGQRVLLAVTATLEQAVEASNFISDAQIGSFAPAQAIASSCHEHQYTRLFRS
ncbi:urease accessory protein UreF [Enterovibrio paralichthyis]|uniref:urease accessory protein UreF n=1 Tax=Enterovibrio paralichthyis TaxID=2853805 RepID=UPI001C444295|nr:urease accessory protein UreF [Enterovibrio paralichthyis]